MEIVTLAIEFLRRALQKAGPYLMVEIVLPGGTLIALALLLYRHRKSISGSHSDTGGRAIAASMPR